MSGPITAKVANDFVLSGNGTTISYSMGMTGKPILSFKGSYKDRKFDEQFSGNGGIRGIDTEHTWLGDLVTVTLVPGMEGQSLTATVLVPGIDLGNANSQQPLTTLMIMSQRLGAIHPGRLGQLQDYTTTMLKGTASHIET